MVGALNNTVVLDLTHVLAGPFCTYQLALLGADVIKIEPVADPDCARGRGPDDAANAQGLGLNYQVQGGNKRALAIDLRTDAGREILLKQVAQADVLVENYATGALAALGLGYEALHLINPRLIHCSITGFGDTGPKAEVGAYDNVIQATSGIMAQCAGAKVGVSFIDYSTGYAAAFAISSALVHRAAANQGTHISVSMLEVAMQMMSPEAAAALHPANQTRAKEPGIACYDTQEQRLMLGAFKPVQYHKLNRILTELGCAIPELDSIDNWPDVWEVSETTKSALAAVFLTRTALDWVELLKAGDLPADVVRPLADAVKDQQLAARGFFQPNPSAPDVMLPTAAFSMGVGGAKLDRAPPKHGEHTSEVLTSLGLSAAEIQELRTKGIVA
ncbi:CaiB/BaiF CoA-transferase family protein [Planktotalea sp.]|uniref:CaiB/BaiF CoA transferase family protein n=1 Tax=Planktotalea sp. TaxID=2029877 RepID=UPI0025F76D08|nr:CaiB/BaiF CoA-transferase family protein [Planktotalea sp.]